jgi:hypothetical protein
MDIHKSQLFWGSPGYQGAMTHTVKFPPLAKRQLAINNEGRVRRATGNCRGIDTWSHRNGGEKWLKITIYCCWLSHICRLGVYTYN